MNYSNQLDGIVEKLKRADESIQNLNAEINQFLSSDPRPYRIDRGFYDNPRQYTFKAYISRDVPLRFSVLAGEIIHHFRSCLDHLIVILAGIQGQKPLNTHQFPICRKREKFIKACAGGQIKGISKSAFRRVVKAQPYLRPQPYDSVLNAIHQMDVMDKHRLLLMVAQTAEIGRNVKIESASRDIGITGFCDPDPRVITKEGVKVFFIDLEVPDAEFSAHAEFTTQIAFGKVGAGEVVPVVPLLMHMATATRATIASFF